MNLKLNEIQENLQLIQLEKGFVVISTTIEGITYWDITKHKNIFKKTNTFNENANQHYFKLKGNAYKILFASKSLNLEGVKVIEEEFTPTILPNKQQVNDGLEIPIWMDGYKEGYKQAKINTYTLEQLKEAMNYGKYWMKLHTDVAHQEFIDSLNQPKVEITFNKNDQPLNCKLL